MGVNAQKRKKKQGPVPTLEESLPKKFKSDKPTKSKKSENGVKENGKGNPSMRKAVAKATADEKVEDFADEPQDFGAAKASLFDDDDEEAVGEFEGMDDVPMYLSNLQFVQF
jgi:hypothetical protein